MSLATENIKDEKFCVAKTQDFLAELKLFKFLSTSCCHGSKEIYPVALVTS